MDVLTSCSGRAEDTGAAVAAAAAVGRRWGAATGVERERANERRVGFVWVTTIFVRILDMKYEFISSNLSEDCSVV